MIITPTRFYKNNYKILIIISIIYFLLAALFFGCGSATPDPKLYTETFFDNWINSTLDLMVLFLAFLLTSLATSSFIYFYISSKSISKKYGRFILVMYILTYFYCFFNIDMQSYRACIFSESPGIFLILPLSLLSLPVVITPFALIQIIILFIIGDEKD
jgi:hypothetical protein